MDKHIIPIEDLYDKFGAAAGRAERLQDKLTERLLDSDSYVLLRELVERAAPLTEKLKLGKFWHPATLHEAIYPKPKGFAKFFKKNIQPAPRAAGYLAIRPTSSYNTTAHEAVVITDTAEIWAVEAYVTQGGGRKFSFEPDFPQIAHIYSYSAKVWQPGEVDDTESFHPAELVEALSRILVIAEEQLASKQQEVDNRIQRMKSL